MIKSENLSLTFLDMSLKNLPSPPRLCSNGEGGQITAEQAVRLLSFRMRSFKVMDNQPSKKSDSFHGRGVPKLSNEGFPPCLRRSGYAQAGLKLRHPTARSVFQRK
jgi:hypothetical protein